MPVAPLTLCVEPRCPNRVTKGRCPTHARAYDLRRGTAQQRGYDGTWAAYSKAFRQRFPLCGMKADGTWDRVNSWCANDDQLVPAQCVQHIVPFDPRQGQADPRFWDKSNHLASCQRCNNRRRAQEAGAFGRTRPMGGRNL